jgi:chromosome partitioning protein
MGVVPTLGIKDFSTLIGVSTHLIYKLIKELDVEYFSQGNRKTLPPASVRKIMEKRGFCYTKNQVPNVINIFGMKGGIGKTSLATALAEGASRLGFNVLAIDLDMQGNLTQSFSMKKHGQPVLVNVLKNEHEIKDVVLKVHPSLDLLPSSLDNSQIEHILSSQAINFIGFFKELLSSIYQKYDLIVIDCPPSINKITSCATCFANLNLIPVNADVDSLDGVKMSVSEIKTLEKKFRDFHLAIDYKIVFNKYDAREKLSLTVMGEIAKQDSLHDHLLPIVVRTDTTFKNTKASGDHIYDIRKSAAKEDCFSLISEIVGINKWVEQKELTKTSSYSEGLVTVES